MMAGNSWNETIADVNRTLAEMNTAISGANGAAEAARSEAQDADAQGASAQEAADRANEAAEKANAEADKWSRANAEAVTLEPGGKAEMKVTESGGRKIITISVPRGDKGAAGAKGDPGRSGVTFRLNGTTLDITTDA